MGPPAILINIPGVGRDPRTADETGLWIIRVRYHGSPDHKETVSMSHQSHWSGGRLDVSARAGALLAAHANGSSYQPNLLSRASRDQAIISGVAASVGERCHIRSCGR